MHWLFKISIASYHLDMCLFHVWVLLRSRMGFTPGLIHFTLTSSHFLSPFDYLDAAFHSTLGFQSWNSPAGLERDPTTAILNTPPKEIEQIKKVTYILVISLPDLRVSLFNQAIHKAGLKRHQKNKKEQIIYHIN